MGPFKMCMCCNRTHDRSSWFSLRYVGMQVDENEAPAYEVRDCPCGSTLFVELAAVEARS